MKYRIHRSKNFTTMSNYHLYDARLSMKAKGVLSVLLALPDDWNYSVRGLETLTADKKKSLTHTLIELEKYGYLVRSISKGEKGRFNGYTYDIYERPFTQNASTENASTEKEPQLNTKELNTKEQNDKIDRIDKRLTPSFDAHEKESSLKTDKPNALSQILVDEKYIKKSDAYMDEYNSFIEKKVKEYGYEQVRSAVRYFATQFRRRHGRDEYGLQVDNRLAYFIQSISNGLMRMATDADIHEEMVKMMEEYDSDLKGA